PYVLSGDVDDAEDLIARDPETFRSKYGIDVRTNHLVEKVDCDRKVVHGTDDRTGEAFEEKYDRLLIASGASPVLPPWEGKDLPGIYTLKTIPDVEAIRKDMTPDTKRVTIIGGGYIGLELAESFVTIGKEVRLIQRGSQLGEMFDEEMASSIHEEAEKHGVDLHLNESVEAFRGEGRVRTVCTDQGEYDTDLVIVAVGVTPNTSFLEGTGIFKGLKDAVSVNAFMETSILDIYAAGDCAMQYHRVKQKLDYIPLGTHANKQGQIAGLNMVDQHKSFHGIVGTSILKFFHLSLGRTGLSAKEAEREKIPHLSVTIDSTHAAGYYSKDDPMTVKLVYHQSSRRLLGGQIIGGRGVDKRVDVLATALYHDMTVDDLQDLDLSYAPPFNSVWDPIQQASRRAE
ncbi:FAD-dependent oxidoreductase, partial [Halobacillus sp. BAB-2008]